MKRPPSKRQSPWQRGRTPGKEWTPAAWQQVMAPWVEKKIEVQEEEKKKKKQVNRGKGRADWLAQQIMWRKHFGHPEDESGAAAASSSSNDPPRPHPDFGPHQDFFNQCLKKWDDFFAPVIYLHLFFSMLICLQLILISAV